jgi:hypothetical protein
MCVCVLQEVNMCFITKDVYYYSLVTFTFYSGSVLKQKIHLTMSEVKVSMYHLSTGWQARPCTNHRRWRAE